MHNCRTTWSTGDGILCSDSPIKLPRLWRRIYPHKTTPPPIFFSRLPHNVPLLRTQPVVLFVNRFHRKLLQLCRCRSVGWCAIVVAVAESNRLLLILLISQVIFLGFFLVGKYVSLPPNSDFPVKITLQKPRKPHIFWPGYPRLISRNFFLTKRGEGESCELPGGTAVIVVVVRCWSVSLTSLCFCQ